MSKVPEKGDLAPKFKGQTQTGDTISLSDFRGRFVALYFYPEDDTLLCTRQACSLRDGYKSLQDANVAVIGVSPDDVDSHGAFVNKYDLPFPLVADPEKKIMKVYGTWGPKNMYGNLVQGTKRFTFLIDPEGVIVHVFKRPKTGDHATEILKRLPEAASL